MMKRNLKIDNRNIFFETGKMAKQADGAVLVGEEGTVVLVTAVASKDSETDKDFFPLFVEYREKFYAAGKIPGGFFKREGRPGEKETLSARLIDRPIRPLFPEEFRYEIQVACSVLSSDQLHQSDVLGITGASLALALSDIPFDIIISGVRVGLKNGHFILNPTFTEVDEGGFELVMAGSDEVIIMVEGGASEVTEDVLVEALDFGHEKIKVLNSCQRDFLSECLVSVKREVVEQVRNEELERKLKSEYLDEIDKRGRIKGKLTRQKAIYELVSEAIERFSEEDSDVEKQVKEIMGDIEREVVRRTQDPREFSLHARRDTEPCGDHSRHGTG